MSSAKQEPSNSFAWRRRIGLMAVVCAAVFLSWRAVNLQVLDNEFLQNQGDARHMRIVSTPAHRGMILDRNGEALAVSTPVASVWADPQTVDLNNPALPRLAKLLGMQSSKLKTHLKQRKNREFTYLKRRIDPDLAAKVAALDIPGIALQREFRRYYPSGEVVGHLLGFTNIDDQGQEGLELAFEKQLLAHPGKQRVMKDRLGRIIRTVEQVEAGRPGRDVTLSIDRRLQYVAYRELKSAVQQHKAESGSLVLLDVTTGEVLALVNQPAFNPNNRHGLVNGQYRNRAVTDVYEPGSTIKPITIAAALQAKVINVATEIDTAPGYFRVAGNTISDFRNYGTLDISHIIQKSSNVGMTKIALRIPKEKLWETFSDFGFGEYPESGFPGESNGVMPFFGAWGEIEQATLSYGYGLSVSPLQLAQSYSILANGGIAKPVSFLSGGKAQTEERRLISKEIARQVVSMLELAVNKEGTGSRAAIEGYRVAGKTGTVKKLGDNGYTKDTYLSLFAGMAPASNPRLVAVVLIDNPGGSDYYGGKVAAPVFSNVVGAALRILNVPPDGMRDEPLQVAGVGRGL